MPYEEDSEPELLWDVISGEGFEILNWDILEDTVLRPRLEEAGFYAIFFKPDNEFRLGPITRMVTCTDSDKQFRQFIYGIY